MTGVKVETPTGISATPAPGHNMIEVYRAKVKKGPKWARTGCAGAFVLSIAREGIEHPDTINLLVLETDDGWHDAAPENRPEFWSISCLPLACWQDNFYRWVVNGGHESEIIMLPIKEFEQPHE